MNSPLFHVLGFPEAWLHASWASNIVSNLVLIDFGNLGSFRRVEVERRLQNDMLMSDDRKQRQLIQHGKRESQFLRLRRTKIGLDDFRTVKVIGKGAFGEVCLSGPVLHPYLRVYLNVSGPSSSKDRFRQDLRDEDSTEG